MKKEPCCYANAGNHPCTCKEDNEPIVEKENMTFKTWKHKGVRYLAVPTGNSCNVAIMDENGKNFGSWYDAEDFRCRQRDDILDWSAIGTCRVQII